MKNVWMGVCLLLMWSVCGQGAVGDRGTWVFCCRSDNDLFRVVSASTPVVRVEDPIEAVRSAPEGAAVLLLADDYPGTRRSLPSDLLKQAAAKSLRLFVEYPADVPGLGFGAPRAAELERAVVSSDVFGAGAPRLRILALHGCTFLPVTSGRSATNHLVVAKVAGFDTAVFGLPASVDPLLFEHPDGGVLVATTRLSHFVRARFAPKADWQAILGQILGWLQPGRAVPSLDWEPVVRPTYGRTEALPADAVDRAIIRGIDWHSRARMLMHPSWTNEYAKYGNRSEPIGPPPDPSWPVGEGECGLLEGYNSRVFADGSQNVRWWLRSDCNGETALSFALRARLDGDARSTRVAGNLLDWLYLRSGFLYTDTNSPLFGLLAWAPNNRDTFFQDNDVKAILGCIGTSALLGTDRWDDALAKNILANFRTTGIYCFRGERLDEAGLKRNGWLHYWKAPTLHYSAHFEVWSWATYLWLYDKTGFAPLLERTLIGCRRMMESYPDQWRWTNGLQQERARMLLVLAWLVRVQDTPEHRGWLKRIATDMLEDQVASGAIREEMGALRLGYMRPPQSNAAYGTGEAPLIQRNGDPIADLLYTCNFALVGLHEAAAATGDPFYASAEERLIEFLLRAQVRSTARPELDGVWFRAFDFDRWDYFGSNSDWGWGAWAVECGWTQGWITTGLALHRLRLNLWDLSRGSGIAKSFHAVQPWMLPESVVKVPDPEKTLRHLGVGKRFVSVPEPDERHPGLGVRQLVDGRFADWDHRGAWLGYEGIDFEATLDLGEEVPIRSVALHCLRDTGVGVHLPAAVELAVSSDGQVFKEVGRVSPGIPAAGEPVRGWMVESGTLRAAGRYLRVTARNPGPIPAGQPGAGKKSWLFVDEILVNAPGGPP